MAAWGLSLAQAQERIALNDGLNAAIVANSRERADYLVAG
jgi:hypothetical protein